MSQISLKAIREQQPLQSFGPIQRKFFFIAISQDALGPGIFAAVARVNHNDGIAAQTRQRRWADQGKNAFPEVERMKKRLPIYQMRSVAEPHIHAVPISDSAA